jgi:hypothetical protein
MADRPRLEDLIAIVAKEPRLHARWLNTFSFLEYIGFRKIVKSQRAETLNAIVLGHAVEEGRHALRLKKLAMQIGGQDFDSYAPEFMICGEEAENYFQSLDHDCEAQFAGLPDQLRSKLTYHYVTWLIERRALDVYGIYQQAVKGTIVAEKLKGLLAEEVGHLEQVEADLAASDPQHKENAARFIALETRLYDSLIERFSAALAAEAVAG